MAKHPASVDQAIEATVKEATFLIGSKFWPMSVFMEFRQRRP